MGAAAEEQTHARVTDRAGTRRRLSGRYGGVVAIPAFRRLWVALLIANFGEAVSTIAFPLLVYDLTESARLLGAMFVIQSVPRVVLAPVAGLLADRLDRRRLMMGADLGRGLAVAVLPLAGEVWQIGVLAALVAVGNAVARPAELAAVPMVVGPGLLVPALSLTQVMGGLMRIAGPAVGAAIVGAVGPGPAFWLQAVCFAGSLAVLWRLRLPGQPAGVAVGERVLAAARRDIAEGLRTVIHTPIVRGLTATESLWSLVNAAILVAGVVLTEETLDLGERAGTVFGLLTATMSAGAVLGALLADRVEAAIGRPRLLAIGYLGPLMLLPAGLTPPLWVLFACWFLLGFTDAFAVIAFQSYLAEAVPDALRGRVYATWGAMITLAGLGTFALTGWLTERIGAPAMLALGGGVVGVGGPLLLVVTGALAAVRQGVGRPAGE